jgi:arginyl-tRNA synthetase
VRADKNFLHFRCATPTLARLVLDQVHHLTHATASKLPEYGSNEDGKGKRALIEYSSPNIAKDFHIGHLRSTIIGAFLANVHKACGWEVVSMNYLGDWGTQVRVPVLSPPFLFHCSLFILLPRFSRTISSHSLFFVCTHAHPFQFGMIAVGFEKYGNEAELEADPIKYLYKIYVQISKDAAEDPSVKAAAAAWFARMEAGEDAALANWRRWRTLSARKYTEEYARLNVRFDVYTGESEVGREWQDKALARLDELGLIADADGAKIVDLEKFKLQKAVLRKKGAAPALHRCLTPLT